MSPLTANPEGYYLQNHNTAVIYNEMKILIAEDDRDFGNILSQYVSLSGFEVTLGRDGREAWELFRPRNPISVYLMS